MFRLLEIFHSIFERYIGTRMFDRMRFQEPDQSQGRQRGDMKRATERYLTVNVP